MSRNRNPFAPVLYTPTGQPIRTKYNAAAFGRMTANLYSVCRPPEEELTANDLAVLRARCRYIVNNYPQAAAAVSLFVRRVIGSTLRIQARMRGADGQYLREENEALEVLLETAWEHDPLRPWTGFTPDGLGVREAMRMAFVTRVRDGEVFLIRSADGDPRRMIPRVWQIVEADRLADRQTEQIKPQGGARIIQGIEVNSEGKPVAYHFLPAGKTIWQQGGSARTERIPADRVIHWYRPDRPGQMRGVPELARIVLALADVEEFSKAKIQAEWIANCLAAWVTTPVPEMDGFKNDDSDTDASGHQFYTTDIVPGTVGTLPAGTELATVNPNRPGGSMREFVDVYKRDMAAALGISFEEFTSDYSRSNYSNTRAGLQGNEMTWSDWHAEFCLRVLDPIYRDALDQLVNVKRAFRAPAGVIDIYEHYVQRPRREWVDPQKEIRAYLDAVGGRIMSRTEVCALRGRDFAEVVDEIAAENTYMRDRGIDPETGTQQVAERIVRDEDNEEDQDEGDNPSADIRHIG